MIHRSPATSFSCITTHWSRGVAISPGRQKILSTSITGSPVISPKRLASVDLPDAPRPMMTTRFTVSSLRRLQVCDGSALLDSRVRRSVPANAVIGNWASMSGQHYPGKSGPRIISRWPTICFRSLSCLGRVTPEEVARSEVIGRKTPLRKTYARPFRDWCGPD